MFLFLHWIPQPPKHRKSCLCVLQPAPKKLSIFAHISSILLSRNHRASSAHDSAHTPNAWFSNGFCKFEQTRQPQWVSKPFNFRVIPRSAGCRASSAHQARIKRATSAHQARIRRASRAHDHCRESAHKRGHRREMNPG